MTRMTLLPLWAARDVLRKPAEGLLVGAALAALIWIAGTATLLTEAVRRTADRLIDSGPSLVVRRIGPAGFAPMPLTATGSVAAVAGALRVRPRIWGPATANGRPIEVVGLSSQLVSERFKKHLSYRSRAAMAIPPSSASVEPLSDLGPDHAVVGPGFAPERGAVMTLRGPGGTADVELTAALTETAGLVAQDTFVVHPGVARRVLGIPPYAATDLALDVFRESEEAAIRSDIADALPFTVAVTTRSESKRRYNSSLTRRGGLFLLLLLPAALAVGALAAGAARDRSARAKEIGLLKAVGWTSSDIVWMHGFRALWIALPSVGLGMALAWFTVFGPGVRWPGALLFGWSGPPPLLSLDAAGATVVLFEVTLVAVIPWLAAHLWPAIVGGTQDPWALLSEEQP